MLAMLHPLTLAGAPAPHLHGSDAAWLIILSAFACAWIGYEWHCDRSRK